MLTDDLDYELLSLCSSIEKYTHIYDLVSELLL